MAERSHVRNASIPEHSQSNDPSEHDGNSCPCNQRNSKLIEAQELVAYAKPEGATDSTSIEMKPHPQSGDAKGKASLFFDQLPKEFVGRSLDVTIPNITIASERFRLGFTTKTETHAGDRMPAKVDDEAEWKLYLTPPGSKPRMTCTPKSATRPAQLR